ncbi:MAG: Fic/DOC family N-terminal domain-containing protein [Cyanobacteria bacterium J06627_28]
MSYLISQMPPLEADIETKVVLKRLVQANRALAELKGVVATIPNERILINTLTLQEAKDSSAVENIITTQDELFRSDVAKQSFTTGAAEEVYAYAAALSYGFEQVKSQRLLTNNHILEIQSILEENSAGFRKLPGTSLKNDATGEVIYSPPQDTNEIVLLMSRLERFMNDDSLCDWDALTKMAVIHHQFESIHPFYDGNGRTGRIINVLYLVKEDLLDIPVLYLSRYINQNKEVYYRLLQAVRDHNHWEDWLLFMLDGIEKTSQQTVVLIKQIKALMLSMKQEMRDQRPKIYSQDFLNNLFRHPYTKIEFVMDELQITRQTASKYLEELVSIGMLKKYKVARESLYLNHALYDLLLNVND